ncbi:MAG: deoxyribonuclease IV [Propionibacteriaceae bacterium]
MIRIGSHVDQLDPVRSAKELGADLAQIFIGSPQSFKKPQVTSGGGTTALRDDAAAANIDLYVHAPYLINVATTNNRVRIPSRKLLQQTIDIATEIGAKGVIVHGGHVTADDDPSAGFANWRKCIDGLQLTTPLLIENTAGGANAMARRMDRIAMLWEVIADSENINQVGFCLDTCHAHAGGNSLSTVVTDILAITGRIDLIHCNDSRDAFDSGADRHENLGMGQADLEQILAVIDAAGAPIVLETPTVGVAEDLALLRKHLAN